MAEDVSRAVGAADPDPVKIKGKEVKLRPLTLKELGEVERDCLKRFRRQYLEVYRDNLDLLSDSRRDRLMEEKIEETAKWDMANLPPKYVVDSNKVRMTDKLRAWIDNYLENQEAPEKPEEEAAIGRYYKKLAGALVDRGILSDVEYRELTGYESPKVRVPYVSWWISGDIAGQMTLLWQCVASCGITREDIETDPDLIQNPHKLMEIAGRIESLTAPTMGNG